MYGRRGREVGGSAPPTDLCRPFINTKSSIRHIYDEPLLRGE